MSENNASTQLEPNDVLASYATKVVELEQQNILLRESKKALELKVKELEDLLAEERVSSVSKATIAKKAVEFFEDCKIPIPEKIVKKSRGTLNVSCRPRDVYFTAIGIRVFVTVRSSSCEDILCFNLQLIPELGNDDTRTRFYPDFHMGYTKVVPKIPKPKANQNSKPKKPVSDVVASVCTGNPS